MQTIQELGEAAAARRRSLGLPQGDVATRAGLTQAMLSRFERGKSAEFGARKLLALLSVLGLEVRFDTLTASGSLDDLLRERSGA